MRYITGIHALNLPCSLKTCGDWHTSALKWVDITYADTESSILGDWGIALRLSLIMGAVFTARWCGIC